MQFLATFIFYLVFLILATLVSVGFGYCLHWVLPISFDTSLIVSSILCFKALYLVNGTMKIANKGMRYEREEDDEYDDDDDEEILIPIGGTRKFKKQYITKKRKR